MSGSKETTGERFIFAAHYRPVDWSPYIVAGFVHNNEDVETMKFDKMERSIGNGAYNSKITIVQKRESGFVPAVGFGYRYDFDNGMSLNTNFAMGFFSGISVPKITIDSSVPFTAEDEKSLNNKIMKTYKDNFHNNYHIFNLGLSYNFK